MNVKIMATALFGALLGLGTVTELAAQSVYRTVDDAGNVAYTDRPPLTEVAGDKPIDVMKVEIKLTNTATVAANRSESVSQSRAEGVAKDIRNQQDAEDAAREARRLEQRAANCDIATARLKKYSEARRLYREVGDGEREYLSSDEIDSERVSAARAVDEWCGG